MTEWYLVNVKTKKKAKTKKKRNLKTEPLVIPTSLEQEMRESNEEKQI